MFAPLHLRFIAAEVAAAGADRDAGAFDENSHFLRVFQAWFAFSEVSERVFRADLFADARGRREHFIKVWRQPDLAAARFGQLAQLRGRAFKLREETQQFLNPLLWAGSPKRH